MLDVGWTVDVCDENVCPVKSAAVVAVECRPGAEDACVAVLAVKPPERQAYLGVARKDKLAIVISEPKPGG